jgi:hypothetical protein
VYGIVAYAAYVQVYQMIFGDILCSFLACTIDVSILPVSEEISDRICLYVVGLQFSRETSLASSMKAS